MKAYRNRYMTGCMFALFPCLLLFSCSKEFPDGSDAGHAGKYSESISFGVAPDGPDGNVQTKGAAAGLGNGYVSGQFVLRSQDSADTLCVSAVISDGIGLQADNSVVTRSAPVTKNNFHDSFHVLAYWKKDGQLVEDRFYMNVDVSDTGNNRWSSTDTYYWPGDGHTLRFCAWAPADAAFSLTPQDPTGTSLAYTVPKDVADQKDIVVTSTDEMAGNSNTVVPLDFRHICTAVQFKFGSQMQSGTVKSVALRGVGSAGTYDMASGTWTLSAGTDDFMQELNLSTTGSETSGSELTTPAQTFMMIPQETLPNGASVEVVFVDGTTGTERTLSASIAGMEWPQGKTVTYRISISPEYELEFISEPEIQDAHYIIYPIHIKVGDNIPGGSWTLTSTDPDNVTLRTDLTILTRRGFWVEEDKGEGSITSTAVGEDITVYAFLTENAGEATREINLELKPTNSSTAIPQTFTISQLCPSWNGDLGCERIEEYDEGYTGYPWGFLWDEDMKISYNAEDIGFINKAILWGYLHFINNDNFVSDNTWGAIFGQDYTITIDFSKVNSLNVATSEDDGRKNTLEIYNFDGINDASSMMQMLEEWGCQSDKTLPTNPTVFAARTCALKNKFNKEISTAQGQQVERAVLRDENLVWYLPARNEAPQMQDTGDYALSGDYWTSTAINDNENAYKYNTVGGSTSSELRTSNLHVRAVRKRP